MNTGLVIFGIIIIGGMFFLANIYITPQQKQQLELVSSACNFNIFGIPIGQIGQSISSDIAQKCEEVRIVKQILSFEPFAYLLGFILFVIGLVIGGRKEVHIIKEFVKEPEEELEEGVEEKSIKSNKKVYKFCSNCGNKINPGEKFCGKCGNKLE